MNNKQIQQMLGIDAVSAEATDETLECLGFDVETAVKAIKCGLEGGSVSRADDGNWLIVDIGLYQWVEKMEGQARAIMDMLNAIWSNPSPAANETGEATGRGALVGNRDMPQLVMLEETAVNGGGAG